MFEARTDGADIELRIVNRTRERQWWCGPDRLLEWVELEVVGEGGEVVVATREIGQVARPTDGYTWSVAPGDALWLGTVDVEGDGTGARATLEDGRAVDLRFDEALRVALRLPSSNPVAHADCLRRAQARWYAASEFRSEPPWGTPGAPFDRVFPSTAEAIEEIGPVDLAAHPHEFRFREKRVEGTMR